MFKVQRAIICLDPMGIAGPQLFVAPFFAKSGKSDKSLV